MLFFELSLKYYQFMSPGFPHPVATNVTVSFVTRVINQTVWIITRLSGKEFSDQGVRGGRCALRHDDPEKERHDEAPDEGVQNLASQSRQLLMETKPDGVK